MHVSVYGDRRCNPSEDSLDRSRRCESMQHRQDVIACGPIKYSSCSKDLHWSFVRAERRAYSCDLLIFQNPLEHLQTTIFRRSTLLLYENMTTESIRGESMKCGSRIICVRPPREAHRRRFPIIYRGETMSAQAAVSKLQQIMEAAGCGAYSSLRDSVDYAMVSHFPLSDSGLTERSLRCYKW